MMQLDILADVPRARAADPATSHKAAARIKSSGALGRHQQAVLRAVQAYPGHTSAEIAAILRRDASMAHVSDLYHEVARRLPELAGVHVRRGQPRTCTVRGSSCTTWWPR